MTSAAPLHGRIAGRAAELVLAFEEIAQQRMGDLPLMNRALQVEAVGFEHDAMLAPAASAIGVLVTPWFMNLVVLPVERVDRPRRAGDTTLLRLGATDLVFLAAHEARVGSFEACSLFSPVFEFADASAARATAHAVLATLREIEPVAPDPAPRSFADALPPARRSFLIGRTAAARGVR